MERILASLLDRTPIASTTLSQSLQEYEPPHPKRNFDCDEKEGPIWSRGGNRRNICEGDDWSVEEVRRKINDGGTTTPRLGRGRQRNLMCFLALVLKDGEGEKRRYCIQFHNGRALHPQTFGSFC
ncbi:hypothetical protein Salat_1957300 [Sesamum alatum]|uniref:Uncharacterized protein n=1 Tax=Sesamum alatum TaxID=300844 RepID=A0AAE1Y4U4_9LAMI|nr:hypothetical protein Salat_1957300 [Sesamum alatum]